MDLGRVLVGGAPAAVALEETRAGARTLARVTLPAPLPPGARAVVDADFETRIPRRHGAFGCEGPRCRLMGGFYPTPAHLGAGGWDLAAAPDSADARLTLRAPPELAVVVNGQPALPAPAVTVDATDVPYATILTDRVLRVATADAGGVRLQYLHRAPRPPDSDGQPLPYVREDIPGLVLDTAAHAVTFLRDQGWPMAAAGAPPVTMVEAPLRHELVQAHGDLVLVSDRMFEIFPLDRVRRYHRFEIVRGVMTSLVRRALGREDPEDRDLAADVLASYLTEVYALRELGKIEYARDLLRPFDFVPAVDQLIYAPLVASSQSYFGDVDDADRIRDDVRRFASDRPHGRLLYNKLLDLLGPAGMSRLARAALGEGMPFRQAAAQASGGDLGWFWRQWLGPPPRTNYRLAGVRVEDRPAGGGAHVVLDVSREGADVREPVEVRVDDRAGGTRTLVWSEPGRAHRFEVDLPAGLASVEVDPRHRLVETALAPLRPSDDPRYDNREPRRWRLLYQGLGALFNVSRLNGNFAGALLLKPQHDLRHAVSIRVFHSEAALGGASILYISSFGRQVDRNTLASSVFAGLTGYRLDPTFGLGPGQARQPGWVFSARLGLDHDTRDFLIDPWRAVGLGAAATVAVTALDDGQRLTQATGGLEALRLVELLPGHVLAADVSGAVTGGHIALPVQLVASGGLDGLRGFFADQLLSRASVIGRLELRDEYVTDLDWNLLHFTAVRGIAGTVFADAAALTSCDRYDFSRRNVYTDVGYSFRVLHDAFGVYQEMLSIDLAFPIGQRPDPTASCLGMPLGAAANQKVVLLVSFLPSF